SSMDAGDGQDVLGKIYDMKVLRRLPQYLAWVKGHLFLAASGTIIRTAANIAMPVVIAKIMDDGMRKGNLSSLNWGVLIYFGLVMLMWAGQYLETMQLSSARQGQMLLTQDILPLTADIVTMVVIVIVMVSMNPILALWTLSVAPVLVLV